MRIYSFHKEENLMVVNIQDTSFCDAESIHNLSRIQRSGYLLILSYENLEILQVSDNISSLTNIHYQEALNQTLDYLFDKDFYTKIYNAISILNKNSKKEKTFVETYKKSRFFCAIHLSEKYVILEISDITDQNTTEDFSVEENLDKIILRCQKTETFDSLCNEIISSIQKLSGYDRVLMYKFDEDGSGTVLAGQSTILKENFLNHRFPASDIPAQARALYIKNKFRIIEDVNEIDACIIPEINSITQSAIDMSFCHFRAVSPIHIKYLKNMGVESSMSISIVIDSKLWGMIACHNYEPIKIPHTLHAIYYLLSSIFASFIEQKELINNYHISFKLKLERELFINTLAQKSETHFINAIFEDATKLLDMFSCEIVALKHGNDYKSTDNNIGMNEIEELLKIAIPEMKDNLFNRSNFGVLYGKINSKIGGLLVIKLSNIKDTYLFFIRVEQIYTVQWAGEPNKSVRYEDGKTVVSPRASFESWKETVIGTSSPFIKQEIECAETLAQNLSQLYLYFEISNNSQELKAKQIIQENIILQNAIEKEILSQRDRLLNSVGEGVYGIDLNMNCFFINPAALLMLGLEEKDVLGKVIHHIIHHHKDYGHEYSPSEYIIHTIIKTQNKHEQHDWLVKSNSEKFPVKMIFTPLYENSQISGVVVAFTDMSAEYNSKQELQKLNKKLELLAMTDPLTQVYNQRYFKKYGMKQFDISKKEEKPWSIILIEIDNFKLIKKTYGNEVSDLVLMMVTKALKLNISDENILARIGCEEFAIILPQLNIKQSVSLARGIVEEIHKNSVPVHNTKLFCTVSISVVQNDTIFSRFIEMMKTLELKMLFAKESGGNCIKA